MRILHVTAQRPDSTGSGVYLGETVRALGEAGHDQAVVAGVGPRDGSPFAPGVRFAPVRFETPGLPFPVVGMSDVMPYAATRYRDLTPEMTSRFKSAFSQAFDDVFAAFPPDVVICHHLYLACGVLMDWLGRHPRARASLSARAVSHGTDIRQFRSHGLQRRFIARGVRSLDCVFALHEAQAAEIVEAYGVDPDRVRVAGTGYDERVFTPSPSRGAAGGGGAVKLVYVGKLWKQKGLMELMGALDLMPADLAGRMRLDLVGGHGDRAERDEIARRASACRVPVRLCGQVSRDALVEAYRSADIFVLPSFSEGLPLVAVEALACGCKVVMSDLPGVRGWFSRHAPGAPIRFVPLPPLRGNDPARGLSPEGSAAFERGLASAIAESAGSEAQPFDLPGLSWASLASRLIAP